MKAIIAALDEVRDDPDLKLVLLTSAGKHFSLGASVAEHRKAQAPQMLKTFRRLVQAVASHPVPVACVVQGRCLGGAFELALCSHLAFAVEGAIFACPEIKLGVFPPVLSVVGHIVLGGATTQRLALTGADLPAAEAISLGWLTALLDPVSPPVDQVLDWFHDYLAPLSSFSLRVANRATHTGTGVMEALGAPLVAAEQLYLELLVPSHDGNEGIEAFLAGRKPQWENR